MARTKVISDRRVVKSTIDDQLVRIKGSIQEAYDYFRPNYVRFNFFKNFIFRSSLSADDLTIYKARKMPTLEFNILEAYISRQRGEFSKQEPSLSVSSIDGSSDVDPQLISTVEGHIRHIFYESNRDNMEYDIYTDILSGGFSAMKITTDYANEMSFDQNIKISRVFDPTMCGFDMLARDSHKGDGRFCFELFPMSRDDFEDKYGTDATESMKFTKQMGGFNWSYSNNNEEIVLVAQYYEKKKSKQKIVQLINGKVMTTDDYEKFVDWWRNNPRIIAQPPATVGKSRVTDIINICRHTLVEGQTLEYVDTDYKKLPIIFVDGNSQMMRQGEGGAAEQVTRPYVYHALGIQKLKNFAGVNLANELENMVQQKWMVAKESIPPGYEDPWMNPQNVATMMFNAFKDDDPNIPLPVPQAVPRIPAPPEVKDTFTLSDEMTQAILGSYDQSLGVNANQLSGIALQEGITQSNATAMPFIVGYLKALNRAGEIVVDLLPKYVMTPRNLPVKSINGKNSFAPVNYPNSQQLDYPTGALQVKVEAGVNFEIQKARSLDTLTKLMQVSPFLSQYLGTTEQGLETLLDNIDIRGIDALKQGVSGFCKQQQQQQQQQQQMAMQMNPILVKKQELQLKAQQNQQQNALQAAQINVDDKGADTDRLLALAKIGQMADEGELEQDKVDAENARTATEVATNMADMQHSHTMDILKLHSDKVMHQQTLENQQNG